MGNRLWTLKSTDPRTVKDLERRFGLPRIASEVYAGRGITADNFESFIDAPLSGISDPYIIPGMKKAAQRLWEAIVNKELIIVHGDYDTDGVTATALLVTILRQNNAEVMTFLPHRFEDGYGFTPESVQKSAETLQRKHCVLVTVDCGITSWEAVDAANELGIDTIITDHHEPSEKIPNAYALLNPKVYPELTDLHPLSGVGMAFKLAHAFIKCGRSEKFGGFTTNLQEVLDYVALGTVADIVPLVGENRIMVKHGIRILKKQQRPGIRALVEQARLRTFIKPSDITFKLAPRLNAAGRLGSPEIALSLLLSDDIVEAYKYAEILENMNQERQQKEEEIYAEAKKCLEKTIDTTDSYSVLVAGEGWHQGVIGIVASRLARDYNRPSIVLSINGDDAQGSGRSIGPLNLVQVLTECHGYLDRFGGHPMAVGLGLPAKNIPEFKAVFEQLVRQNLTTDDLVHRLEVDVEAQIDEFFDLNLYKSFEKMAPFGHGNPQPIFLLRNVAIEKIHSISSGRHSRGSLIDSSGFSIDFIAFNTATEDAPAGEIDVVVMPGLNDFYDEPKPQLQIVAWRSSRG